MQKLRIFFLSFLSQIAWRRASEASGCLCVQRALGANVSAASQHRHISSLSERRIVGRVQQHARIAHRRVVRHGECGVQKTCANCKAQQHSRQYALFGGQNRRCRKKLNPYEISNQHGSIRSHSTALNNQSEKKEKKKEEKKNVWRFSSWGIAFQNKSCHPQSGEGKKLVPRFAHQTSHTASHPAPPHFFFSLHFFFLPLIANLFLFSRTIK